MQKSQRLQRKRRTFLLPCLAHPSGSSLASLEILHAHLATTSPATLALSLRNARADSQRPAKDIDAIEFTHRTLGFLDGVQVHETIAGVPARKWVGGDADAHHVEAVILEQLLNVGLLSGVEQVANVEPCAQAGLVAGLLVSAVPRVRLRVAIWITAISVAIWSVSRLLRLL
jgi:hypothetical protein